MFDSCKNNETIQRDDDTFLSDMHSRGSILELCCNTICTKVNVDIQDIL